MEGFTFIGCYIMPRTVIVNSVYMCVCVGKVIATVTYPLNCLTIFNKAIMSGIRLYRLINSLSPISFLTTCKRQYLVYPVLGCLVYEDRKIPASKFCQHISVEQPFFSLLLVSLYVKESTVPFSESLVLSAVCLQTRNYIISLTFENT